MSIIDPIDLEIDNILNNSKEYKANGYEFYVSTVNEDIKVLRINDLEIIRDYGINYSDIFNITFTITQGKYNKRIFPYRDNLEGILIKKINNKKIISVYKLILHNSEIAPEGSDVSTISEDKLDISSFLKVTGQLIEKNVEALRGLITEGIYRKHTLDKVIYKSIHEKTNQIVINGKRFLDYITLLKLDNNKVYDHIIIPSGTNIVDLVPYLQNSYGLYKANTGFYYQKFRDGKYGAFIYPLYRTNIYQTELNIPRLNVINSKRALEAASNKSTFINGLDTNIIIANDNMIINDGESSLMDQGVGIRHTDGTKMMKKPVKIRKDGVYARRAAINREVIAKKRNDGINIARRVSPSENIYKEYSKVSKILSGIVNFTWRFSDPDLIHPAMPVNFKYQKGNNIIYLQGLILKTHTQIGTDGLPITNVSCVISK